MAPTPIGLYLALGPTSAGRQLETLVRADRRFVVSGSTEDTALIERELDYFGAKPDFVVIELAAADAPLDLVRALVRRFALRLVVVDLHRAPAETLDRLMGVGAVHAQSIERGPNGALVPRAAARFLRRLAALGESHSGLEPSQTHRDDEVPSRKRAWTKFEIVGIGSSAGGLGALIELMTPLGHDFPLPIVLAQHLSAGSDAHFVAALTSAVPMPVAVVEDGVRPRPGRVLVAPGDRHVHVGAGGVLATSVEPAESAFRPSANVLLSSIAASYGAHAIGVVLSGMGADGADGLLAIRRRGGRTFVQDHATASSGGMPSAALALAAAESALAPAAIAARLIRLARIGRERNVSE